MRVILMHKSSPRWEAGATPSPELIARVGTMIGEMAQAGALLGAEGLRATSQGVRLAFAGGARNVTKGPFPGANELIAGFMIVRTGSLDEAIEWATRFAGVVGDVEIDIRPVTEPWDLGMTPKPAGLTTRRFMVMHKADRRSEAGIPPTPQQAAELEKLVDAMKTAGVLLSAEWMQPSSKGVRFVFAGGRRTMTDGPFAESKELIAGFVILRVESMREAIAWAPRYAEAVGDIELDVLALSAQGP